MSWNKLIISYPKILKILRNFGKFGIWSSCERALEESVLRHAVIIFNCEVSTQKSVHVYYIPFLTAKLASLFLHASRMSCSTCVTIISEYGFNNWYRADISRQLRNRNLPLSLSAFKYISFTSFASIDASRLKLALGASGLQVSSTMNPMCNIWPLQQPSSRNKREQNWYALSKINRYKWAKPILSWNLLLRSLVSLDRRYRMC